MSYTCTLRNKFKRSIFNNSQSHLPPTFHRQSKLHTCIAMKARRIADCPSREPLQSFCFSQRAGEFALAHRSSLDLKQPHRGTGGGGTDHESSGETREGAKGRWRGE